MQDCGYYYEKDNIEKAADQLFVAATTFDSNMDAYYDRSAKCIFRHYTYNPDAILGLR